MKKFAFALGLAGMLLLTGCGGGGGGYNTEQPSTPNPGNSSAPSGQQQQFIEGRIVAVEDGDTITVANSDNAQYKIRLSCIDAPENGQDFGQQSKDILSTFIAGKEVKVVYAGEDQYGRLLGYVETSEKLVNLEQVKNGMAWVYREYCDNCEYYHAEKYARDNHLGLWAQSDPVPPWEYRNSPENSQGLNYDYLYNDTCSAEYVTEPNPPSEDVTPDPILPDSNPSNEGDDESDNDSSPEEDQPSCGTKKYCTQMSSCSEAMYYYIECGLGRLDGDKDGVPCESLCK